jgi:hypothetical protein
MFRGSKEVSHMARLAITVRDLDDPEFPVLATSDREVLEGVARLIADRLRGGSAKRSAGKLLDLARPPQRGSDDSDE